jgi:hypothetical protein
MHVFKGNVHHNTRQFIKGQECPKDIFDVMLAKDLIEPLPEAVKPVKPEPVKEKEEEKPKGK